MKVDRLKEEILEKKTGGGEGVKEGQCGKKGLCVEESKVGKQNGELR